MIWSNDILVGRYKIDFNHFRRTCKCLAERFVFDRHRMNEADVKLGSCSNDKKFKYRGFQFSMVYHEASPIEVEAPRWTLYHTIGSWASDEEAWWALSLGPFAAAFSLRNLTQYVGFLAQSHISGNDLEELSTILGMIIYYCQIMVLPCWSWAKLFECIVFYAYNSAGLISNTKKTANLDHWPKTNWVIDKHKWLTGWNYFLTDWLAV